MPRPYVVQLCFNPIYDYCNPNSPIWANQTESVPCCSLLLMYDPAPPLFFSEVNEGAICTRIDIVIVNWKPLAS